jgi:hypothetical protein
MSQADLDRIREWATSKLSACQGPLDAAHPYLKVLKSLDTVLAGMNPGMTPTGSFVEPTRKTQPFISWIQRLARYPAPNINN